MPNFKLTTAALLLAASTAFSPAAATAGEAQIKDGNFVVGNGDQAKAVFPFGYWINVQNDYYEGFDLLKKGGFNTAIIKPQYVDRETWPPVLDDAAEKGIMVWGMIDTLHPPYHLQYQARLEQAKDHPAYFASISIDDSHNFMPEVIATDSVERVKEIDDTHPILQSMAAHWQEDPELKNYVEAIEGTGLQTYAIEWQGIDHIYDDQKEPSELSGDTYFPYAILQTFNWGVQGEKDYHLGRRWPTAAETDLATWLSVAAGVKGVIYYSLDERLDFTTPKGWLTDEHPDLFDATVRAWKEIEPIQDFMLHGELETARILDTVYHAHWTLDGERVHVFINTHPNTPRTVKVDADGMKSLKSIGVDRGSSFEVSDDGRIIGEIGPESVQLFRGKI